MSVNFLKSGASVLLLAALFSGASLRAADQPVHPMRAFTHKRVFAGHFEEFTPRNTNGGAGASGLTIVPTYDISLTSHPRFADIQATIESVIAYYKANFSDPITVTINFHNMDTGLGINETLVGTATYAKVRAALISRATSAEDKLAVSLLPDTTGNPLNGNADMELTYANLRVLGFKATPGAGSFDSRLGLNLVAMNISSTDTDPELSSMFSVTCHEVDEVLGMPSALGPGVVLTDPISPVDLFRYAASGARSFTLDTAAQAYFSLDGVTLLEQYNQSGHGDAGDWIADNSVKIPRVQQAFVGIPNLGIRVVPSVELIVLDAIGWTFSGTRMPNLFLDKKAKLNAPSQITPGVSMTVTVNVINIGIAPAGPSIVRFLLSKDNTADASDIVLGEIPVGGLAPNVSATATWTGNCPPLAPGHYYFLAVSNPDNIVTESEKSDNLLALPTMVAGTKNTPPVLMSPPVYSPNPAPNKMPVTFTAAATDSDGDTVSYLWDFGDGNISFTRTPAHAYTVDGIYNAKLTINDGFGGIVATPFIVTVSTPIVKASVLKKKLGVNFEHGFAALDITVSSPNLTNAPADGAAVQFYFGDVTQKTTRPFDSGNLSKGKATGGDQAGKFTYNAKQGSLRYTNAAFDDRVLQSFGVVNTAGTSTINIPIYFSVNNSYYGDVYSFSYTVSSSGVAKGN